MPNIVIYGVHYPHDIKLIISKKMQKIGLEDEVIVTTITSTTESCKIDPKQTPFLRIYISNEDKLDTIISALRELKLGLDVEIVMLYKFIPKRDMILV